MNYRVLLVLLGLLLLIQSASFAQGLPVGEDIQGTRIDLNPDGTLLATVTNQTVEIMDASNLQIINTLPNMPNFVNDVKWSSDGNRLAIATGFNVQIWEQPWDTSIVEPILTIQVSVNNATYGITSIDWHPNENQIMGVVTPNVMVWNAESGLLIETFLPKPGPILTAIWSPVGNKIALGELTGRIYTYDFDTSTYELAEVFDDSAIRSLAWSTDGTKLVAGTASGLIQMLTVFPSLWDDGVIETEMQNIITMALNPIDNDVLVTGNVDGDLAIVSLNTQQVMQITQQIGAIPSVVWSPDGSILNYSGDYGGISTMPMSNVSNSPPIANAGVDQIVYATNGNSANVSLDGSGSSDPDGSIDFYVWESDASLPIEFGVNPIYSLDVGIYIFTLTVTDDEGLAAIDEVTIIVESPSQTCDTTVFASDTTSLISAINTGNVSGSSYSICLENSTYSFTASDNSNGLGANALPVITGDISIVGNGAILERDVSASNFRFFRVASGASLSLENLSLQNGDSSGDGGAIYNEGIVTLDTVTVQDNQAAYEGGGIYNDGDLTVTDSTFTGNDAVNDDGGAIDNHGTLTISGSLFENNHSLGDDGGAIWTDSNTTVNISNSTFTLNSADDDGGAIMSFGTITITGETSFLNNTATTAGGAISADTGSISMTGGDFTSNTATNDDGGAIISFAPVTLNDVTLDNNSSGDKGGAIYVFGTSLLIENGSVLSNNDAGHNGGAVFVGSGSGNLTISDSTLSLNTSPQHGGALYLQNGSHVISNTIFDQNSSVKRGGAIYTDSTLTIQTNSQFTSNQASDDGGAIYANGTINISDSTFTLNSASDQGGVFRGFVSGSSSLTYSCIFSNSAGNTSGVYSASSNFDATNNWWGATDGPSGDGNGSGDAVNWGVDFANFVTTNCADAYQQGGTSSLVQNSSSNNLQNQAVLADSSSFTTERSPYSDNFDAENALWFTASPRWLQSDTTSVSGSAWFIDTSVRGQSSVLEMTSWIELRNRNRIRLVYSEQAELASSDVVTLEIQTEGSSEWTVIAQNLGGSYTWREQNIDLLDYRRQTIRLRWRVDVPADEPVGERSQYYAIDDLEITHRRQ